MTAPADSHVLAIPEELKALNQWCLWKTVVRDGLSTKIPFQSSGQPAKSNDPTTWASFDKALAECSIPRKWAGIGFVFSAADPYCGIDLDGCRNPSTGEIAPWSAKIIHEFATYCEISPSGTGVKLWVRGRWKFEKHKQILTNVAKVSDKTPAIEVYDSGRYFATTGAVLNGQLPIGERQQQLDQLGQSLWTESTRKPASNERSGSPPDRAKIISRAAAYLAKVPGAISGQGGSDATIHAACELFRFGLTDSEALAVFDDFNGRCEPPWNDREIEHKLTDARDKVILAGEFGCRLTEERPQRPSRKSTKPNKVKSSTKSPATEITFGILNKLKNVVRLSPFQWHAMCPISHEENSNSLTITVQKDGKAKFDCVCGADWADIVLAAGATVSDTHAERVVIAANARNPADDRPEIIVTTDEADVNESVIQALGKDVTLFQRGGKLVHIIAGEKHDGIERPDDAPRVAAISLPGLRERLTLSIRFVTIDSEDERRPAHPPRWSYEAVAARGQWSGIRSLAGVVTAPVLRPDGSVLNAAGYDPMTGLLFDPQGVSFPIIERPSHGDAIRAADSLLDVVADFPFGKPDHRAAWLAYLLTPLARFAFTGPAPLFLVDANIRGSGKSLLCDIVALIVTGREMSRMSNPKDDDECRKRITALALAGETLCLIDNIIGGLGCASLDAALTATVWKDRVLGASEIVDLPLLVTWSATGNNVVLHADTSRRVAHIRLDSRLENPEQRDGFRHPNLKAYVRRHRPKLLANALTILAAFCRAGRPQQTLPTWGSFEGWSDLVRQAVVWCGQADPGATRTELVERSDGEAIAYRELLAGWDELDPDCFGLTTTEILARLAHLEYDQEGKAVCPQRYKHEQVRNAVLELCPPQAGHSLPSSGSLGKKLGHLRGRVVSGRFIDRRPNRKKTSAWFVSGETAGDDGDDGDVSSHIPRDVEHTHHDIGRTHDETHYEKGPEITPATPASPASTPTSNDSEGELEWSA